MYISEVSGHRSAAEAVGKALRALRPDIEIIGFNAFNYTNPITEKIINKIYMGVIKATPQLWEFLYDNPSVVKKLEQVKKNIHKFNSPKLKKLFDKFRPDAVLCTQAFPCGMVADYKKNFGEKFPLVAVLTDFAPHSFWLYENVDYYVTPSESVTQRFIKKGVPPEKIKTLGIPFDPKFNEPADRHKIFQKLKLDPSVATVLIMGGGQGLGPIKKIIKSLEKTPFPLQEIVVCGTNKKLYKSLKSKIKKYRKKILLFGYVNNINELMSASGAIITKPGGVTTAEVLTKRVPMIIVQPIPGQEANNANYLTEKGAAIRIDEPKEIHRVITGLFRNPWQLNRILQAEGKISKPNASFDIAELLLEIIHV
ncbi:MAG: glycosyltransferase [Candidatus Omnitrophota bacterium]|nr:glycosyltransferase [Candidatus Omnitrophota bacterium]